ncbi:MAG: PH domain-containing protein [Gemmatimonadota bacterium]|nr:PH domain-containing protein [Gemmatimonadota bacterium]MDE2873786.1 PH domain-containing protein [Gemmatimonadota bacterium]
MFVNPEVPPDALPSAEDLDWQPLHPRFVRRLQTGAILRIAVLAAAAATIHFLAISADAGPVIRGVAGLLPATWAVVAVLSAWALIWPMIAVPRRGYVVREKDILHRSGVFWRSVKAVPFNRVQHTKTDSGPLDRRFGLANLSVFPAGAGGHKIRGLGADTAEELRVYVSARIEAETEIEAEAETEAEPDEPADEGC